MHHRPADTQSQRLCACRCKRMCFNTYFAGINRLAWPHNVCKAEAVVRVLQGEAAARQLQEREQAAAAAAAALAAARAREDAAFAEHLMAVSQRAQLDVRDLDQEAVRWYRDVQEVECPILYIEVEKVWRRCGCSQAV